MFVQDPKKNSNNQAGKDAGEAKKSDQNSNSDKQQIQPPPAQPPQNQPQQNQNQKEAEEKQSEDYVNSYQPPKQASESKQQTQQPQRPQTLKQASESKQQSQQQQIQQPASPQSPKQDLEPKQPQQPKQQPQQPKQPPQMSSSPNTQQTGNSQANNQQGDSETIERQNIFFLLGVEEGPSEEKESFLDELQQIVWEDFLENDLDLLITSQEKEKVNQIIGNADLSDLDKQEKIIEYLETLMPVADLEEIMLEKALELKQEMVKERVEGMKEYYAGQEDKIAKIQEAAQLFAQGKWRSGAELLNEMVEADKQAPQGQSEPGE